MISLRVVGKMSFPHFVNRNASSTTKKIIKEKSWDDKQKREVEKEKIITVMKEGTIDIISNPSAPIKVGDQMNAVWANYEALEVIESREAKGDWSFVDFDPMFQKVRVKFIS